MSDTSTYEFTCLDCGAHIEAELEAAPASGGMRCPQCGSTLVRQTFASYLRNALARPRADLEDLRDCHFG